MQVIVLFTKRDLYRLLIPLMVEQVLAVLVGMADVVMVAAVGEAAVSGVSLVDSISTLIIQLLAALATGGAVVCSQYIGRKDVKNASIAANQLLLSTFLLSILIMAVALAGNRALLDLIFGQIEADVMGNAQIYFFLSALSYPFLAIYNSCAALYRSMGNSKVSMKTSLCMNAINVTGNALCVYGLHMGVAGVGIPTLVSRATAAIIMLVIVRNPQNLIHVDKHLRLGFHPHMIRNILRIGIPAGMENSMFQLGKILVQSLVSSLGTVSIAGFAVASNLVQFEYLPGTAIGLGIVTVIGQCVGAGEHEQAKQYTKYLLKINYGILAVLAVLLATLSAPLVSIYNLSPGAASIAVELIVVHSFAMVVWPISFALPNALRAATDVKFTMLTSIFSMWAFRIGLSYVLVLWANMGVMGVWVAMFADWVFRAILFFIRFCSGRWLHAIQKKVQPAAG